MSRSDVKDTTKVEVLEAVVDKLRADIAYFNESTCFLSVHPEPPKNAQHNIYATVAPVSGRYVGPALDGGGAATVMYEGACVVTLYSHMKLDRVSHGVSMLTDADRGLLVLQQAVLASLAASQLYDNSGQPLLTQELYPINDSDPRYESVTSKGDVQVMFGIDFNWNVSLEPVVDPF